jgi:hypothetical protein
MRFGATHLQTKEIESMKKPTKALRAGALFALLAAGCATTVPSVPPGYTGPLARINDTVFEIDNSTANIFYLEKINGQDSENAMIATRNATAGRGMSLNATGFHRSVPTQAATFTIVGRTTHAAPIQSMIHAEYQVRGELHFTPEANKTYEVLGELNDTHSVVWIEDKESHLVQDHKIEIQGKATLGVFEK